MRGFSFRSGIRAPGAKYRRGSLIAAGVASAALLLIWAVMAFAAPASAGSDEDSPQAACPPGGQCFADVPSGSGFYEFVNRIYEQDIVTGYPCGGAGEPCDSENRPYYRPVAGVTRQQMSKFVDQARRQPGIYIDTTTHDRPIYARTTKSTGVGVYGVSDYGVGVYGETTSGDGVYGESSAANAGHGVAGVANCATCYAVYGSSTSGTGVSGNSTSGYGTTGTSPNGTGVSGISTIGFGVSGVSTSGTGVVGASNAATNGRGVYGSANCATCNGVYGTSANGNGVYGSSTSGDGVYGVSNSSFDSGVHGVSNGPTNAFGVYGEANCASCFGVRGTSTNGHAVSGVSTNSFGVYAVSNATSEGRGVVAISSCATCYGVYATSGGWAGYFQGNVNVTGTCCGAGAGLYKIDHPLDPENKYLYHSAVESPDMKTVYDGNVTTDASGEATVVLPDYFGALNRDFRYQLTVIGDFAQAVVLSKIKENRFTIKSDGPNVEVSWQVTGVRKDPFAEAHRAQTEVAKPNKEQGKYLHPEEYGQPPSKGVDYNPELLGDK
jgi:hypothetical protein